MSRAVRVREAFSLLEVIIATAILAGSAMVLFSLISLGTKYGNRAEERTIAISQAQSVLDEFVASMSSQEIRDEVNGVLPSIPPRNYRIKITPFEFTDNVGSNQNKNASNEVQTLLFRIKVELFETKAPSGGENSEPLCQLSRLVRRPRIDQPMAAGTSATTMPPANKDLQNRNARGGDR